MRDNLKHIRHLPNQMLTSLDRLIVNRHGRHQDAFMITRDIISVIKPNQPYQFLFDDNNLPTLTAVDATPPRSRESDTIGRPKHAVLRGNWVDAVQASATDANILGGVGQLILEGTGTVTVPIVPANEADLAFYRAQLISPASIVNFATHENLPLTEVSIGKDYVEHYLAETELGGGEYIEYHDQPHFWAPQNEQSGGHILLGRQAGADYYFTGFHIPFGSGVYLSPYTLHSDAYLLGDYLVVYALSGHYSTVLLRDNKKSVQRLDFSLDQIWV